MRPFEIVLLLLRAFTLLVDAAGFRSCSSCHASANACPTTSANTLKCSSIYYPLLRQSVVNAFLLRLRTVLGLQPCIAVPQKYNHLPLSATPRRSRRRHDLCCYGLCLCGIYILCRVTMKCHKNDLFSGRRSKVAPPSGRLLTSLACCLANQSARPHQRPRRYSPGVTCRSTLSPANVSTCGNTLKASLKLQISSTLV